MMKMKNQFLTIVICFFLCVNFVSKTSAQLRLSAGIQHIQLIDEYFTGFEPIPSFFTLRKDFNHTFSGEVYFSHINVDDYKAIDFAGYELKAYRALNFGINSSVNLFTLGRLKTAFITGMNYRINAIEDINGHPSYPDRRSADIKANGIGAQIGIREIFRFNNGIEFWGTARYNRNFKGEFTMNLLSFDLNVGIPIAIELK